jgi:hypothetical protein
MTGRFKQALLEKGDMSGMTQKGGHKRSTESGAGLTQKGVEKYRRQNPGSKLKTAVTTPPSKLKPGSKAAKRRKSFCARSRGWTGERGKAARRRWNCSTDVNPNALQQMAEMITRNVIKRDRSGNRGANIKDIMAGLRGKGKAEPKKPEPKKPEPKKPESQKASTDIVRGARMALAEACWKGYKARGMKKKGNRMVPNCVKEATLDDLPTEMKLAARRAIANGEDPVNAVEKVRKYFEAKADDEHYGKKEESDDPRMKTTPASIQQAGGDPKVYKQEKAKKDPQPTTKQSKKSSRRATVGRGGGKYRRERIQPPKGHEGPSAPTRQVSAAGDAKGDQKKNFQKGGKERPMSKKQVNRMGVRGQEKKIAAKKKGKTGAANIQLMRDMGVLKTDSRGRVTLAKKKR